MYLLFTILIVIAAVLVTLLVLVQNSKGGGLAAGFSSSNQVLGVRKTTDFLEKATWSLTAFILILSIFAASMHSATVSGNGSKIDILENVHEILNENQEMGQPYFDEEATANDAASTEGQN